ncbi:MAG TPA: hypothetical protein VEU94_14500 [Terriglobales bacterium]|nr:hypothetical protein [Terriglobales bacterium]
MDNSPNGHELELLLPQSVTRPLWRSLLSNLRDRLFPEKLPPLQITSRPLNTGMLIGDAVSLPWYRTVFTNLGNVINPEVLPPLELESRPLDVGELVSDQMGHMWWTSLLRNLADRVAPERLPALQLTSTPVDASLKSGSMQLARWSSLITLPKVPLAERKAFIMAPPVRPSVSRAVSSVPFAAFAGMSPALADVPAHAHPGKLQSALSRSRLREALLITLAGLEALYLLATIFGLV